MSASDSPQLAASVTELQSRKRLLLNPHSVSFSIRRNQHALVFVYSTGTDLEKKIAVYDIWGRNFSGGGCDTDTEYNRAWVRDEVIGSMMER